jgi:hypothetical protein
MGFMGLHGLIDNNKEKAEAEKDQRTNEGILNYVVLRETLI